MTDRAERARRAIQLCRQLSIAIAHIVPPSFGTLRQPWERVEQPSARFLELLDEWEANGNPELVPRIRTAYDAVIEAWRAAAEELASPSTAVTE